MKKKILPSLLVLTIVFSVSVLAVSQGSGDMIQNQTRTQLQDRLQLQDRTQNHLWYIKILS